MLWFFKMNYGCFAFHAVYGFFCSFILKSVLTCHNTISLHFASVVFSHDIFPLSHRLCLGLPGNSAWCKEEIFSPLGLTWGKVSVILLLLTLSDRGQRNTFCTSLAIARTWHHYLNMCYDRTRSGKKETLFWPQLARQFFKNDLIPLSLFPKLSSGNNGV